MSPDIHTLAGAYVLDAIESDERDHFEAHLAECESCRDEVRVLQHAAAALAPQATPPATLRVKVLAAAERTLQLPPLVERPEPAPDRRWLPRLGAVAAAVLLVAGVGIGVRLATHDDAPAPITAAQVFAADDVKELDVPLGDGEVHLAVSKSLNRLAVDGADMPAPPPGRVYQLWLVHNGQATSLSVMEGDSTTAVNTIPAAGTLAVTTEPPGGSKAPTSTPILTLDTADL